MRIRHSVPSISRRGAQWHSKFFPTCYINVTVDLISGQIRVSHRQYFLIRLQIKLGDKFRIHFLARQPVIVHGKVGPTLLKSIDSKWRPNSRLRLGFRLVEVCILSVCSILLSEVCVSPLRSIYFVRLFYFSTPCICMILLKSVDVRCFLHVLYKFIILLNVFDFSMFAMLSSMPYLHPVAWCGWV